MIADDHLPSLEGGAELDKPVGARDTFGDLVFGFVSSTWAVFRVRPVEGEFEPEFWLFFDFLGYLSVFILLAFCFDCAGLVSILGFLRTGFDVSLSLTCFRAAEKRSKTTAIYNGAFRFLLALQQQKTIFNSGPLES